MNREDIILTEHAVKRLRGIGIDAEKAKDLLTNAKRQKKKVRRELYKTYKYGYENQGDINYYLRKGSKRYPGLLFTVHHKEDKWIIITATRSQKMN